MPELQFKGKEFVYNHHLTVPYRPLEMDAAKSIGKPNLNGNLIDSEAKFVFASNPKAFPDAVPFDMFQGGGLGHRGDDCTFETLRKEFAIRDPKTRAIAEIAHDADLDDGKFGRSEGLGLDRVLIGWAHEGLSDEELLRRGVQLIEGLYHAI